MVIFSANFKRFTKSYVILNISKYISGVSQSSAIIAGLGLAAIGFTGRYLLRRAPQMSEKLAEAIKSFPTAESFATSKYYRGGFDTKMNKREAALILGVSPTAPKNKVYF